jgi:hypothetical protein
MDMEKQFRPRDVRAAREAQTLHQRLGYPSEQRMVHGIRSGTILNTATTGQDVERMIQIYGKPAAMLQGKSTRSPGRTHEVEILPQLVEKTVRLHIDVMFYEGHAFLLSVGVPIALIQTTYLGKRKTTGIRRSGAILDACRGQLSVYQKSNFTVTITTVDNEGGLVGIKDDLGALGISLDVVAPGEHAHAAERAIRTVKDTTRAVTSRSALGYKCPLQFIPYAVLCATYQTNLLPSRGGLPTTCPREALTGIKEALT